MTNSMFLRLLGCKGFVAQGICLFLSLVLASAGAEAAPVVSGPPLPPAVKKYMRTLTKGKPLNMEVTEVRLKQDAPNAYVIFTGDHIYSIPGVMVITNNNGKAAGVVSLSFEFPERPECAKGTADCALEAYALPESSVQKFALMVRTRYGCGVARWEANSYSYVENVNCKTTPRQYVLNWAECRSGGGSYVVGGMSRGGFCEYQAEDAGRSCTDGSQCRFGCESHGLAASGDGSFAGKCISSSSRFGCTTYLKGGKQEYTMCVD